MWRLRVGTLDYYGYLVYVKSVAPGRWLTAFNCEIFVKQFLAEAYIVNIAHGSHLASCSGSFLIEGDLARS